MIKFFPARESLVCDIPGGKGKIANIFLQCVIINGYICIFSIAVLRLPMIQNKKNSYLLNAEFDPAVT